MAPLVRGFIAALKIELRRPASLLACAGGLVAGLAYGLRGPSSARVPAEILAGGLLAVAALGELPSGLFSAARRRWGEPVVWAVARLLFPLAGVAAASVTLDAMGLGRIVFAMVATACLQTVVHAAGGRGSEPATAALLLAAVAAVAAATGLSFAWLAAGWAAAVWPVGSLARIVAGPDRLTCPRGRGRTVWLWPLPSQGRLRPAMTAAAMVAGIVAMAAWLVPQPPRADRYASIATAVFIALAVPQMTLADSVVDRLGWAAVLWPVGRSVRVLRGWPPAGRIAFAHATMLAWPLVVAGVLTARLPGTALAASSAVCGLLLVATIAAAIALGVRRWDGSAETAHAAILAIFAACCGWWGPQLVESLRVSAGSSP